jgi:hypothetical protein
MDDDRMRAARSLLTTLMVADFAPKLVGAKRIGTAAPPLGR